jgi:hypothetical protein
MAYFTHYMAAGLSFPTAHWKKRLHKARNVRCARHYDSLRTMARRAVDFCSVRACEWHSANRTPPFQEILPGSARSQKLAVECSGNCRASLRHFFRNRVDGGVIPSRKLRGCRTMFSRLGAFSTGAGFSQSLSIFWWLAAVVFAGHFLARGGLWQELWFRAPAPVWGFGYAVALSLSLLLAPDAGKAFIYFQF